MKKISLSIIAQSKQNKYYSNGNRHFNYSSSPNSPEPRSPSKISAWQDATESNIINESSLKKSRNQLAKKQFRSPIQFNYDMQTNRDYRFDRPHMNIKKLKEQLQYLNSIQQNNKELLKQQFPKSFNPFLQSQYRTEIKFNGKSIQLQTKQPLKSSVYLLSYLFDRNRSKKVKRNTFDNSMAISMNRILSKNNKKRKNQTEKDQNRTTLSAKSQRAPTKKSPLELAQSFVKVKQFQMPRVQLYPFKQGGRTFESYQKIK